MDYLSNFIKPELLVLIPVLYIAGAGLKRSQSFADNAIPLVLGVCGVVLALAYVLGTSALSGWRDVLMAAFTAVTQGILCAGCSALAGRLLRRGSTDEGADAE